MLELYVFLQVEIASIRQIAKTFNELKNGK